MGRERDAMFTAFARDAEPRLVRQALLLTGDPHHSLDLVQATLLTVYLRWSRIDSPMAYARTTLIREFLSDRRRRRREVVTGSPEPTGGISGPADAVTTRSVTLAALVAAAADAGGGGPQVLGRLERGGDGPDARLQHRHRQVHREQGPWQAPRGTRREL